MRKKFIVKNHRKKKIIFSIIFILLFSISIGYSVISTNLSINGTIDISKYEDKTLYGVLRLEALNNGLAREYTGIHHDSFTEEPSKKIYHWYAENDSEGTQILDKNNVIFAGHCWQMIRTTDTGGVKMIYNGEAENNQCLDTRGAHVGYGIAMKVSPLNSTALVGTDFSYNSDNNTFKLSGSITSYSSSSELVGKYTCRSSSVDANCSTLYLIASYNINNRFFIPIWSTPYYYQFGKLQFNARVNNDELVNNAKSLSDVGYMYGDVYAYDLLKLNDLQNLSQNRFYGSSVTWDGTNYTLVNTIETQSGDNVSNDNISTHHYTCVSSGIKTCTTVAYVFASDDLYSLYYILLKDGNEVDKAIADMLTKNTTNSIIKMGVDAWYKHYLLEDYDNYIEDTIFCNDRSIHALNAWNPNGGMINENLLFKNYYLSTDLNCMNSTDQFSVSNNNAKLTYKVGLMSSPEMNIINNSNARKTGQSYWLASPISFSPNGIYGAFGAVVATNGGRSAISMGDGAGVRPAVSLKPGIEYSGGDGSMANPYIVSTG